MDIATQLASALGRRDEEPNIELAKKVAAKNDAKATAALIELLQNKDKNIQSDAVKVLDEISKINPSLTAAHSQTFLSMLSSKNNRLQWGAMAVLDNICNEVPAKMYSSLPEIMEAAEKGSVITRDHAVSILIKLCAHDKWNEDAFRLLKEQLHHCPTNQLPMYAENCITVIKPAQKPGMVRLLTRRLPEIEKDSKRNRVAKVIKKLSA